MKVHLRQIPEGDTLHIQGDEDPAPLELESGGFTPLTPLSYSLDVGLSGGGLFATGTLSISGKMQCVACLEDFEHSIKLDSFALQMDLLGGEAIDLTPVVREDIHLALPAHPRCDSGGEKKCPARGDVAMVLKRPPVGKPSQVWDALDKLKSKNH